MSELNFKNCNFNEGLKIRTSSVIKPIKNNSQFTMIYNGTSEIINKKMILLNNHYDDEILINSDAIIRILDNFSCEKITISGTDISSIYLIGDITRIKVLEIKTPCSIFTCFAEPDVPYSSAQPKININLDSNSASDAVLLKGSFTRSIIENSSYSDMTIIGNYNKIIIKNPIKVQLDYNCKVSSLYLNSSILLTASKNFFDKIGSQGGTIVEGPGSINVDLTLYKVPITSDKGIIPYKITSPGNYSIKTYLILNHNRNLIGKENIIVT